MEIKPEEVESIKIIGTLFDNDVKIVKTVGGFNVAIGKKKKGSKNAEAIAAGSHPAIVCHQISKQFGSDFKPALAKSEHDQLAKVEDKTLCLPSSAINNGMALYTLSKGSNVDFVLSKHGLTLAEYNSEIEENSLVIKKHRINLEADKDIAESISRAMREKAYELNLSEVKRK